MIGSKDDRFKKGQISSAHNYEG